MKRVLVALIPLVAFTAAAMWWYHPTHAQPTPPRGQRLMAPDHWVPMEAILVNTADHGGVITGRYYRGADGSIRNESGRELDKPGVIAISNIEQKRYYEKRFDRDYWESSPMFPPPNFRPFVMTSGGGLEAEAWPAKVKGFDVHRRQKTGKWQHNDTGEIREGTITEYLAPTLNFLAVLSEATLGGRAEYTDIKVRPQPKELFAPPVGAKIVDVFEPRGIISAKEAKKAGLDYGAYLKQHNEQAHKHKEQHK